MTKLADEYQALKIQLTALQARKKELEIELKQHAGEVVQGSKCEVKITEFERKGSVDYHAILDALKVTVSSQMRTAHTKPATTQFRFTVKQTAI